jgi:hypothetical protein
MSHQIDFQSHGSAAEWNGYRSYSELVWKIMVGNRPFLLNREPPSTHYRLLKSNGFEVIAKLENHRRDGVSRSELSSHWAGISDDDLTCAGALIQARENDLGHNSTE